jgi:RNA polymerase sigma-70 factor, ECF subfamily
MLHQNVADIFDAEGQSELSELWLRAALNRTVDGPRATRLATLLEQRRAVGEAVSWYERATEVGDPVASARLAVLCHPVGSGKAASLLLSLLLLSLGRSRMPKGHLAEANRLAGALAKAGQRHRAKLIADCRDEDLLYWVGCSLLVSGSRDVAAECYSAAMTKGHATAMLSLYDLQMSLAPNQEDDALADVQSLTSRLAEAIKSEPTDDATIFTAKSELSTLAPDRTDRDALVQAAVDGDPCAIDGVLRWIRPLVLRYCRARVGGYDIAFSSADETAQEVCLAVLSALPDYRDQGRPFLAFVYGIASHKVADAHRSAARNRAELVPEIPDTTDQADGPEAQVMHGELAGRMARLLESLPSKQREVLHLRVVVGLSEKETAEAIGSTTRAVRVAQHRALNRLREILTQGSRCQVR